MSSSNMIGDIGTVITNGPSSSASNTTLANAIAAAGPIMDYKGNCNLLLLNLKAAKNQLGRLIAVTDSTDSTNLTYLKGVLSCLSGSGVAISGKGDVWGTSAAASGSPSTTVIADMTAVITAGPAAATTAASIAAAGPIMDYVGMCHQIRGKFKEAYRLNSRIMSVTDQTYDSVNYALLNGVQGVLA